MSVKGWWDYDVTVVGSDENGFAVSELRKVGFTMFDLIRSGYNPHEKENIAKAWENYKAGTCAGIWNGKDVVPE
jgi:hypothetical protein